MIMRQWRLTGAGGLRAGTVQWCVPDSVAARQAREALQADGWTVVETAEPQPLPASAGVLNARVVAWDALADEGELARWCANPDVPCVVLAARRDLSAYVAAVRAGAGRCVDLERAANELPDVLATLLPCLGRSDWRVLVVDDDEASRTLHAELLRRAGMQVRTLSAPQRLFDAVQAFAPDVLLMVLNMPDIDGVELALALRQWRGEADLPVVFLSAETDAERQRAALVAGADDFLVKPVEAARLVTVVQARAQRGCRARLRARRLEALQRQREHILQALDAHAIVSITDAAGRITYANDRFCTVSGYACEELLGANHRIVKSGVHPPAFFEELWATISAGRIWHGEVCNRRKDGCLYWVVSTIAPVLGADGTPVQYVSIRTDVTALKEAQQALELHKERLRRGQIYANIGTWDWNIQTGELYWSERIAPLFGHPEGELETSYENFLKAVHPEDRQAVIDAVNACVERDVPYEIEHRVVWPDGTVRWLLERGAVQRDTQGRPLRMLGVVQDIHARKMAELALARAREEAERASRAKSEFLSSMSHELRTPMNAILGFAQLLQAEPALPQEARADVDEILKAGQHLLQLINEVLDLSRIEAGRVDLSLEPVELRALTAEAVTLVLPLAQARAITLEAVPAVEEVVVRADRTRLKQVILNLLSNAIKYNRPQGRVQLLLEVGPQRVRLLVSDTGPGIPAERLGELFQPFNRLGAEASEVEGTGIGLVIARRLMEMMGGHIGVESVVGTGSTFWIELPQADAAAVQAAATAALAAPPPEVSADAAAPRHTVLYIEDNPANLRLMAQVLARRPGIELLSAHTASLGLELARARRPDLIVLDISMPGLNGYQVLAMLREDPATRTIPVVALTANALPGDVQRGRAAGFDDYLTKPIDVPRLLQRIDELLAARPPRREGDAE